MRFVKGFIFIATLFVWSDIQAQTGTNPQNSLLPEINPQDIEIRSEFRARFPGLRRQPILGFNPKPRVFRINPNRMPFMETRDEAVASIAITQLDRPAPPSKSTLKTPDRTIGLLRAGVGSFVTPEAELYAFHSFNERTAAKANINYQSTDGHLDDHLSSFRFFDGSIGLRNQVSEDLSVSGDIGFLSDFNRVFDLAPIFQAGIGETAKKEYLGFGAEVNVTQTKNALEGWELNVGVNTVNIDLLAGATRSGEVNEQNFNVDFGKYWAGRKLYETFKVEGSVRGGNYQYSGISSRQWIDARGGLEYRKMLNFSAHISAKGGIAYVSDGLSSQLYINPELKLRYNLRDAVIITGSLWGRPEMNSVYEHHQINRLLNTQTDLQHSYNSGVSGEIAFQPLEGNRIFGGMTYQITKDYAFYSRDVETQGGTDFFTFYNVDYGKANIFEFYGGITQQLVAEKFWFDAKVYARRLKLSAGGDIPFEERFGLNASLSYKLADDLTISGWSEYTGKREAPSSDEDLKAFVLVNGSAEYQITNRFGVYLKVLNILGQKYELWEGYEERPFQVYGGLTVTF
ncbi:MAG: TonB-dependent receptor [Balneola sp.]|nr:MAG: TonB-dependent receptor [Balneola sp.]